MRPLSIVAALQYYLPHRTGYTLHVQRVAEALVARGHRVTVRERMSAGLDLQSQGRAPGAEGVNPTVASFMWQDHLATLHEQVHLGAG